MAEAYPCADRAPRHMRGRVPASVKSQAGGGGIACAFEEPQVKQGSSIPMLGKFDGRDTAPALGSSGLLDETSSYSRIVSTLRGNENQQTTE